MARRFVLASVVVLALALLAVQTGAWVSVVGTGEYDRTTVTARDADGETLATVDVRIADTRDKRLVGLSRTEELGPDEGMLFVYDEPGTHGFVMRDMAFPLDIVFVAADGTVTEIHHAPAPDPWTLESQLETYTGNGTYVLEVERGWANRTGVDVGDRLRVPLVTALNDDDGTALGTVRVEIADNHSERYTGLSDTESLEADEGMLFVHEESGEHAYVMRRMDFPLDIVFADANGTVTEIHHAPVPPEGADGADLRRYRGTGKYVLEVERGWTNETGLEVGDRLRSTVME